MFDHSVLSKLNKFSYFLSQVRRNVLLGGDLNQSMRQCDSSLTWPAGECHAGRKSWGVLWEQMFSRGAVGEYWALSNRCDCLSINILPTLNTALLSINSIIELQHRNLIYCWTMWTLPAPSHQDLCWRFSRTWVFHPGPPTIYPLASVLRRSSR